MLREKHRRIK